jgi:hypothetical protein
MRNSTRRKMHEERRQYQAQQRAMQEAEKLVPAAIHEAAHAVVYDLIRKGVEYVELQNQIDEKQVLIRGGRGAIASHARSSGFTLPKPRPLITLEDLKMEIVGTMAGPMAEAGLTGDSRDEGDNTDIIRCVQHFKLSPEEAKPLLYEAQAKVRALFSLDEAWAAVVEIAEALIDKTRVSGDEVHAIVDRHGREKILESWTMTQEAT